MIELRWHVRERELSAFVIEGSVSRTYRVLQYRYRVHPDKSTTGFTEWQDVPVIDDRLPPAAGEKSKDGT